jgi:hypothetical protein
MSRISMLRAVGIAFYVIAVMGPFGGIVMGSPSAAGYAIGLWTVANPLHPTPIEVLKLLFILLGVCLLLIPRPLSVLSTWRRCVMPIGWFMVLAGLLFASWSVANAAGYLRHAAEAAQESSANSAWQATHLRIQAQDAEVMTQMMELVLGAGLCLLGLSREPRPRKDGTVVDG